MEYFEHGDLGAFIDSVPSIGEKDAKVIVQQVLEVFPSEITPKSDLKLTTEFRD
jgi:hypothetical protein